MFCIGEIKDYGGTTGIQNYGFISQISPERYEDVFFHISDLNEYSVLRRNHNLLFSHLYVAYNLVNDKKKPWKTKAESVCLVSELKPESLYRLIKENDLGGTQIASLMKQYCFDLCLNNDPTDYLRFLDDEAVKKQLIVKASSHSLDSSVCEKAIIFLNKGWATCSEIISLPVYAYEMEEKVAKLCAYIKEHYFNRDISPILNCMPESFLLRNDIIQLIGSVDIDGIIENRIDIDKQTLYELARKLNENEARKKVISALPVDTVLDKKEMVEAYDDEKLAEWIDISWENCIKGNYAKIRHIEADEKPKSALIISECITKKDNFNLNIWDNLTSSCKVRYIIYLSNFTMNQHSFEEVEKLASQKHDNDLINGMLYLLMIHYYADSSINVSWKEKAQELFQTGHNLIMDYITDFCFPNNILKGKDIPHDLNVLLEKCISDYTIMKKYYCDARIWNMKTEKRRTVFCPRGKDNPQAGHECIDRNPELTKTLYSTTNRYEYQYMVDFIRNLHYEANVMFMCSGKNGFQWEEYPFKISAYVNMLVNFAPHMKCKCGAILQSNKGYSKKIDARVPATVFYCPIGKHEFDEKKADHDMNVYLNYCNNCEGQIDSRECHLQETNPYTMNDGYYHCMYCGKAEHISRCPNCGEVNSEKITFAKNKPIICRTCNHSGDTWKRIRNEKGIPLRFETYQKLGVVETIVDDFLQIDDKIEGLPFE